MTVSYICTTKLILKNTKFLSEKLFLSISIVLNKKNVYKKTLTAHLKKYT